jgi:hypothetical protein
MWFRIKWWLEAIRYIPRTYTTVCYWEEDGYPCFKDDVDALREEVLDLHSRIEKLEKERPEV